MVEELYNKVRTIKKYAIENNVPIILDDSLDFLIGYLEKKQVKTVLEIGTAIGYSAIMMALSDDNIKITTIERDKERYLEAVKNIKKMGLEEQITLIFNDALDTKIKEKFDLIFIDAAKSKNEEIFNHFENNLNSKGSIITDNLSFHGYVEKEITEITNRNIRGLVKKIKKYISFLENNVKYKTVFYEIGDGISISEKRM
jgi:predicted O-methyltransferase YrrM